MGWTWEVQQYVKINGRYVYETVYGGESLLAAISAMREAKRTAGAVSLTWR